MIVREPPYDLIALFADDDAQRFIEQIIERGQSMRCLRKLRWASVSDPMHDSLCKNPERELDPYVRLPNADRQHYLLLWDQDGSGREKMPQRIAEDRAIKALHSLGVPEERILAVAIQPELEVMLVEPALDRCIEILAKERKRPIPRIEEILRRVSARIRKQEPSADLTIEFGAIITKYPKEILEAVCACLQIPYGPVIFHKYLGPQLPVSLLKRQPTFQRVTDWLARQFPPEVAA